MPRPQSNHVSENLSQPPVRWGAVGALSALLGLRMLGLFMVLPVLALHVRDMPGATPLAAGLALGIYGLTQAIFQVPFGRLSDRLGRRPVIVFGLVLFAAGSALAAVATDPWLLVLGRALQGAGAISAAVMAMVSDVAPPGRRTRVMALVGIVIGMAFMLAFVAGPLLSAAIGVGGLFWLSAAFAVAGIAIIMGLRPSAAAAGEDLLPLRDVLPLVAPQAAGIFILHALMTATFLAVPMLLQEAFSVPQSLHGWVYLPVMLGSLLLLAPLILLAERRSPRLALLLAVLAIGAGQAGLLFSPSAGYFYVALLVFFGGFNFVEAQFPAQVSQAASARARGSALGVYSTAQFLGAFTGGVFGGLLAAGGPRDVLLANAVVAAAWLAWLLFRKVHLSAGAGKSA